MCSLLTQNVKLLEITIPYIKLIRNGKKCNKANLLRKLFLNGSRPENGWGTGLFKNHISLILRTGE